MLCLCCVKNKIEGEKEKERDKHMRREKWARYKTYSDVKHVSESEVLISVINKCEDCAEFLMLDKYIWNKQCVTQFLQTGTCLCWCLCFIWSDWETCMVTFGKHTAKLNGWSINFTEIDLNQFCLRAHRGSHFIANQSFWKHLTKEPVLTNKPSI